MNSFMKGSMLLLLLLLAAVSINADDEHCGGLNKTIPAKDLTKKIIGDWVLVWMVSNHQRGWDLLPTIFSSHMELRHVPEDNIMMDLERNKFVDQSCSRLVINMTMPTDPEGFMLYAPTAWEEKNGVSFTVNESGEIMFFETCEDCIVMDYKGLYGKSLMIYKREGHHTDAAKLKEDHDSYKKLAVCMGIPHDIVFAYDVASDFCYPPPEPPTPEPPAPEPPTREAPARVAATYSSDYFDEGST